MSTTSATGSKHIPGSSTSTDNSSASGSTTYHKAEFGKKHRKIIRILTVIAYVISVSTAALLLSAYYVFIWEPIDPTKTPTAASPAAIVGYNNNHFSPTRGYPSTTDQTKHPKRRNGSHHYNTKPTPHQIPTPQSLIMESLVLSSTTPQPPFKNASPAPNGILMEKIRK